MGVTKTERYKPQQLELSSMLKALGHPARVAIVEYLLKADDCICGDIVNELPLAQPTVSQHLRELKTAGIIRGNIEGTAICYCVNKDAIDALSEYFRVWTAQIHKKTTNCC